MSTLPEQLHCPNCGSDCIHHDGVDIFERQEDAYTGTRVRVRGVDVPTHERQSPHQLPRAAEVSIDVGLTAIRVDAAKA
jgi:hypothetical protein